MPYLKRQNNKGFTLTEVVASVILLGLLLVGAYKMLGNTTRSIADNLVRERAIEVARRQMEFLLVTRQEPESTGLETVDDIDPDFTWKLELEREPVGDKPATLANTIIHATVTVSSSLGNDIITPVELHRFFGTLEPKEGNAVAVPLKTAYGEDEIFQLLRQMLGRDPTPQEVEEHLNTFEE